MTSYKTLDYFISMNSFHIKSHNLHRSKNSIKEFLNLYEKNINMEYEYLAESPF